MRTIILFAFLLTHCIVAAKENPGKSKPENATSNIAANCTPSTAMAELNINNVRTTVLAGGDMWWNLTDPKYEIPLGSGKHSMFGGSLWIGGIDAGGQVRVAAQTYRQNGNDFWPGALDTTITDISINRCQDYNRHWKVSRQNVIDFLNTGIATPDIISWLGNGNTTFNESQYLAPFYDSNGDGIYNHLDGDYPYYNLSGVYPTLGGTSYEFCDNYLFGDQNIWWVINDVGNMHTETGSDPIGLEIRCQAFVIQSASPAINNSTFYKYQMINRSSTIFTETYFGQWADPDLGN